MATRKGGCYGSWGLRGGIPAVAERVQASGADEVFLLCTGDPGFAEVGGTP